MMENNFYVPDTVVIQIYFSYNIIPEGANHYNIHFIDEKNKN